MQYAPPCNAPAMIGALQDPVQNIIVVQLTVRICPPGAPEVARDGPKGLQKWVQRVQNDRGEVPRPLRMSPGRFQDPPGGSENMGGRGDFLDSRG